jgi:hypothetical protein
MAISQGWHEPAALARGLVPAFDARGYELAEIARAALEIRMKPA